MGACRKANRRNLNAFAHGNPVLSGVFNKNERRWSMYGYVYITTNLLNGKKYIGKKTSPKFIKSYKGSGKDIREDIKQYGTENFSVEMLQEYETKDELNRGEREWIAKYNASESEQFYNIARGGLGFDLGITRELLGDERYEKYIQSLSKGVKESYDKIPGLREKRAELFRETRKGMTVSQEQKDNTSKRMKEYWSENRELAMERMAKGWETYKEHYKDHSVWDEHPHPWLGKKHSEETRKKISEHTDVKGIKNPRATSGVVLFNGEEVFSFNLLQQAHEYLGNLGIDRRKRYRMIHGETINGYSIIKHTKSQTTIETQLKEE